MYIIDKKIPLYKWKNNQRLVGPVRLFRTPKHIRLKHIFDFHFFEGWNQLARLAKKKIGSLYHTESGMLRHQIKKKFVIGHLPLSTSKCSFSVCVHSVSAQWYFYWNYIYWNAQVMLDPVKKKVDEISRTLWIVFSMFVKDFWIELFLDNFKKEFHAVHDEH